MLGVMFNQKETQELEYILKKELEEILFDLSDERLDRLFKQALEERYTVIFRLYARFAPPAQLSKFVRKKMYQL